jgi:hypothetical protein
MKILGCTAALAVALMLAAAPAPAQTPAPAMPGMDVSSMDCSNADSMMMSMMHPGSSDMAMMPPATASVDKAFAMSSEMMMSHAATMAKIELKCGKNPKAMAQAQKMLDDIQQYMINIQALQNGF